MNQLKTGINSAFKKVSHVIFDMDGLLLDTEIIYTKATINIVTQYGKTFDWSIKAQLMGLLGTDSAKKIVELLELPLSWEEYYELSQEQYETLMPHCELRPDTERVYKRVVAEIAKEHGRIYTPALRVKVLGRPDTDGSKIIVSEMPLPMTPAEFTRIYRLRADKQLYHCKFMPGAERLVKHLHHHKIPIAVATSSSQKTFDIKATNHKQLFSYFNHIVCGGSDPQVKAGKPSPDIFLICASRFADQPPSENCLVFEDAPNGVTAALDANMQCVMVPDPNMEQSFTKDATLVIESLEDFRPELFGLPPMQ